MSPTGAGGAGPILVWGAGAIGGSLGAAFLRAGHAVAFVDADASHVAAIRERGLRIEGPRRAGTVEAPAFLPGEVEGAFDRAFLCVTAQHARGAVAALAPRLSVQGSVVSAQDGLDEREIAAQVGPQRTMGCLVDFGADDPEPGVVHPSGPGAVVVGELDGADTPRLRERHALMRAFEPAAVATPDIWGVLRGKLACGAPLFATALTDDPIADVLDDPAARPLPERPGREVGAVAQAEGVRTDAFDGFDPAAFRPGGAQGAPDRSLADMVAHNRRSTKTHAGIRRDLAIRRRRTEAEAQLGPIVEAAGRAGLAAPLAARLMAMIGEIEAGRRPMGRESLAQLARAMEAVR